MRSKDSPEKKRKITISLGKGYIKILINLVEFSTKIINFDKQINNSQTDPNALKHEINLNNYFTLSTLSPCKISHDDQNTSMKSKMEKTY